MNKDLVRFKDLTDDELLTEAQTGDMASLVAANLRLKDAIKKGEITARWLAIITAILTGVLVVIGFIQIIPHSDIAPQPAKITSQQLSMPTEQKVKPSVSQKPKAEPPKRGLSKTSTHQ